MSHDAICCAKCCWGRKDPTSGTCSIASFILIRIFTFWCLHLSLYVPFLIHSFLYSIRFLSFHYRANLSLAALFAQCGGLQFLKQLQFLTTKLQRANPPSYHEIDPTTLPPKEIVSSIKNTRTELIFTAAGQKKKLKNSYPDFGFHSAEILFIGQAVEFLVLLAQVTTQDFDPAQEDLNIFQNSSPPAPSKKKHISFRSTAIAVRSTIRVNGSSSPSGSGNKETSNNNSKKILKRHNSSR